MSTQCKRIDLLKDTEKDSQYHQSRKVCDEASTHNCQTPEEHDDRHEQRRSVELVEDHVAWDFAECVWNKEDR